MALPANYKQIASNMPASAGAPGGQRLRASGGGSTSERNKDAPPLFAHNNHGNPAFTPQKSGKTSATVEARAPKPPKPPEKPIMPYMRYSKKIWDSVKAANPDLKLWEIGKKIGAMWKNATDIEKQEFIDEYETEKVKYQEALKTYHSTPEYLAWNKYKTKQRASADGDVHETPTRSSSKSQQERRIDIQPAEDEEDQDDGYSFKHVAYARFLRNHRLINEIFSDAVVPDVRSVVTTQRMQVLKRQVTSLTMHQTKLEAELQQMEEKFEAKKRKLIESSETFQEELKKHCKPAVDDETFQKMVQRQYEEMRRERQRTLEEPAHMKPKIDEIKHTLSVPPQPNASQPKAMSTTETGPHPSSQQHHQQHEQEPMETDPPKLANAAPILKVPTPDKSKLMPIIPQVPPKESMSSTIIESPKSNKSSRKTDNSDKIEIPIPPNPSILRDSIQEKMESSIQPPSLPAPISSTQSSSMTTSTTQAPHLTAPIVQETVANTVPTPTTVPPHHGPPPHHLPPHMGPHQGIPGHPGLPPHPPYGGYAPTGGPTRSPYYPPQYAGHPSQPYGQYPPYPYHQQYGPPPPSHYMSARPPLHYHSDHPGALQSTPHGPPNLDGHNLDGPHHGAYGPPQLGSGPIPSVVTPSPAENEGKREGDSVDSDKKDGE